jgi:hypothetical protein
MTELPSGLVPLPADVDVSGMFSANTTLTPQQQRDRAFVLLNQEMAPHLQDAEAEAVAKLAAALGDEHASTPTTTIDERKAVKLRMRARHAAQAALEAGYRP